MFSFALMSGGEGRRFGSDKTKACLSDKPLYLYGLELGLSMTDDVIHVSRMPLKYEPFIENVKYLSDELPNQCPMAGMITAAKHAKYDTIFVLSADSPLISKNIVEFILGKSEGYDGAIPVIDGKNYNLAAAYSKGMLLSFEEYYNKGLYKLKVCCDNFNVNYINEDKFTAANFNLTSFLNINTMKDLEIASNFLAQRG